jgi:AraC-like DNA-binding protein
MALSGLMNCLLDRARAARTAGTPGRLYTGAIGLDSKNPTSHRLRPPPPLRARLVGMNGLGRPAPPLEPFVRCYVQLNVRLSGRPLVQPIPARSAPILEFTLGEPGDVLCAGQTHPRSAYPVNVVGVQTYRRVQLSMRGHVDGFVVVFQPGGLSALLSVPSESLTNQDFDGRAVFGRWVDDLRNRLGASSSFAERVRHADHQLLQHCPSPSRFGDVATAARALRTRSGNLRISDLVQQSGLSARQFERRFVAHIGMAPKLYARVVRFEAALKRKKQVPGLRWTDVAHELGYYDHMHMVHDFERLAGASPSRIAPEVDTIVADEINGKAQSGTRPERVSIHPLLA